jgi:coatomer protein complex subunit gamma
MLCGAHFSDFFYMFFLQVVLTLGHFFGLQATDVVPSNARSHTCLLAGKFLGDIQVLVRLSVGIDSQKQVAMKLAVRSEDAAVSDIIHEIINS